MIAVDTNKRLFYEGSGNWGHGIWPSPVVSIATVLLTEDDLSSLPTATADLGHAKLVFREDSFDPVTRIRRGRFYVRSNVQPVDWHVQTHPAYKEEVGPRDHHGNLIKQLYSFNPWSAFVELKRDKAERLIALGVQGAFTLWHVIGIERIVTGEDMVTLRARSALGVLPEIQIERVPEAGRDHALQTLDKVVESVYRAGSESVIDRCRDAAQACLGVWMADRFKDEGMRSSDLSAQIKSLEKPDQEVVPVIIVSVCRAIARLHARCKPNEQVRREGRLPVEGDAESAVAMLGLLLRELEWCRL